MNNLSNFLNDSINQNTNVQGERGPRGKRGHRGPHGFPGLLGPTGPAGQSNNESILIYDIYDGETGVNFNYQGDGYTFGNLMMFGPGVTYAGNITGITFDDTGATSSITIPNGTYWVTFSFNYSYISNNTETFTVNLFGTSYAFTVFSFTSNIITISTLVVSTSNPNVISFSSPDDDLNSLTINYPNLTFVQL
jgi:hypothetical protein